MNRTESEYLESIAGTVDFDFASVEGRQALSALTALTELIGWAGDNRLRLSLIPALLRQDTRSQRELARDFKYSQVAVSKALSAGVAYIAKLSHRAA